MSSKALAQKNCKIHETATYDDGGFSLAVELPYDVKIGDTITKFLRLQFDKKDFEHIVLLAEVMDQ